MANTEGCQFDKTFNFDIYKLLDVSHCSLVFLPFSHLSYMVVHRIFVCLSINIYLSSYLFAWIKSILIQIYSFVFLCKVENVSGNFTSRENLFEGFLLMAVSSRIFIFFNTMWDAKVHTYPVESKSILAVQTTSCYQRTSDFRAFSLYGTGLFFTAAIYFVFYSCPFYTHCLF